MGRKSSIVLEIEELDREKEALKRVITKAATQISTISHQKFILVDLLPKRRIKPDDTIANIDDGIDQEEEEDGA